MKEWLVDLLEVLEADMQHARHLSLATNGQSFDVVDEAYCAADHSVIVHLILIIMG